MQLFMPPIASSAPGPDAWAMSMIHDCIKLLTAEKSEELCTPDKVDKSTFPAQYDRCVTKLNAWLMEAGSGSLTVWVFLDSPPRRSALGPDCDYQAILQLLILTFPDIRWVTLPADLAKAAETSTLCKALLAGVVMHQLREETLLDCHGLQSAIRETINREALDLKLPQRRQLAVAIDEEESYAYFNAYAAYRFGEMRAAVVSTEALFETRLRRVTDSFQPNLVIEDLFLSFPDRGAAEEWHQLQGQQPHMSNLKSLDDYFQVMKTASTRVFVTVGHTQAGTGIQKNKPYLQQLEGTGQRIVGLHKPVSGLFRFWFEAMEREPPRQIWKGMALWANLRLEATDALSSFRSLWRRWRRGRLKSKPEAINKEGPHSAPGRLLLVATRLIARAESLLGQVASVKDAVRGAVLSTQASELLGGRTPTTAFEALSLKHAFEVLAECQFQGVEGVIDMNERFEEIREQATDIGSWFESRRSKQSVLNAQMKIAGRLALILREKNQFDEEQRCLSETRDLYQQLWFARRPRILMLFKFIIVYINWLLSSVRVFVGCIAGWIVILALLYFFFDPVSTEFHAVSRLSRLGVLARAFETFFSLQKTDDSLSWVDALAIVLGVAHLGVFISHLYSSSARR